MSSAYVCHSAEFSLWTKFMVRSSSSNTCLLVGVTCLLKIQDSQRGNNPLIKSPHHRRNLERKFDFPVYENMFLVYSQTCRNIKKQAIFSLQFNFGAAAMCLSHRFGKHRQSSYYYIGFMYICRCGSFVLISHSLEIKVYFIFSSNPYNCCMTLNL